MGTLCLSRKLNEEIKIGDDITIIVKRIGESRVKLAIVAPKGTKVLRGELALTGSAASGTAAE